MKFEVEWNTNILEINNMKTNKQFLITYKSDVYIAYRIRLNFIVYFKDKVWHILKIESVRAFMPMPDRLMHKYK